MADHATTTQQRYPWRAVARTVLAVLIGVGIVVPVAVTIILSQFDVYLPGAAKVWLVGASAFTIALSGAATRILAIPAVDTWLKKLGLSSSPNPAPAVRILPAPPLTEGTTNASTAPPAGE